MIAPAKLTADETLRRDGFRRNGPGLCSCQACGDTLSTNALARASHLRSAKHLEALERRERKPQR